MKYTPNTGCPRWSSQTGEPNLSPNSCRTFTTCCRSKAMRPQPSTPKLMGRQNVSTKKLKNTFESLSIIYKLTGPIGYPSLLLLTTIMPTHPPAKVPLKSTMVSILTSYQVLNPKPRSKPQPPPPSCPKCRKSMLKPRSHLKRPQTK